MAKKNNFWSCLILALIVFLAVILRFWRLSDYPSGFHIDEASLGYNAYSLLKTGRDENGKFLPLHIDMFGDNRPAGYQYLDILPVKIFGLTEFATRFPSALFGALTPLAIFILSMTIFANFPLAAISAGIIAFSPWHLVVSRASAETIVALFFIILGASFFIKAVRGQPKDLILGVIFWLVSLFFYHTSRVFLPLLGAGFLVLFYFDLPKTEQLAAQMKATKKQKRNFGLALVGMGLVFLISLLLVFGSPGGTGRFQQISIFHFPEIRLVLEEQIREDGVAGVSILAARAFHNKVVNYGLGYLKEYFRYFSPNFLFIEGGLPLWYQVPNMGLMYLIELPFLLAGLYLLIKNSSKNRLFLIPMIWLFLGPTVAALTRDDVPNIQRSLVMLPALIMITAYGLYESWQLAKKKAPPIVRNLVLLFVIAALWWNFSYFLHQYLIHAKVHRPWYRFNGFKEMVLTVEKLAPGYDRILISKTQGGAYMHFLFFQKIDPVWYQSQGSPKDKDYGGFGKLIFFPQDCPRYVFDDPDIKFLSVARGTCEENPFIDKNALPIFREDGTVAFRIYPGGKASD